MEAVNAWVDKYVATLEQTVLISKMAIIGRSPGEREQYLASENAKAFERLIMDLFRTGKEQRVVEISTMPYDEEKMALTFRTRIRLVRFDAESQETVGEALRTASRDPAKNAV